MEEKGQQMFKSKVCGTVQEVIFPDFPDDDNTVTTTVTKSRRVSFGTNIIKEFIVGSAVSAQCVSEYEQAVSSSDSSNPNSSMSAVGSDILDHNPSFLPETSTIPPIPKPDFESSEYPKPPKFSRTICFSADSPTADMEFTEGCITLAKSILDKKNKEMTVIIQAKSKEPKDDDRSKREDVTKFFEGSQLEMSMTRCLKPKENKREERRFDSEKTRIFNKFDDEMSITRCDNVLKMRQSKLPDESDFMTEDSKENRMPLDLIMRQLDRDDSDSDLFNPEKSFNDFLNAASFESEKLNLNESMDISREFHQVAVETSRERMSFIEKTQEHVLGNFSSSDEFDAVIFKSQSQENDHGTPVFQESLDFVRDMSMEVESQENLDKRNITNLLQERTNGEEFFGECMDLRRNAHSTAVEEMEIETNEERESDKVEENEIREMEVEPNRENEFSINEKNEMQKPREMEMETHEEMVMETSMVKKTQKIEEKAPEKETEVNVQDEKAQEKNFEKEIETSVQKEKEIEKNIEKDLERHMEKKTEVNEEKEANLEKGIEQNMQKKINQTLGMEMEVNMQNEIQKQMGKELERNTKEDNEASVQKEKEMEKNVEKKVERNMEKENQENTEKKANLEKEIDQNVRKKVDLTLEMDIEVNVEKEMEKEAEANSEKEIETNMENEFEADMENKMQTCREKEIEESMQKEMYLNVGKEIETTLEEDFDKNAEKETNLVEGIETNKEIVQSNIEKVTERNDEMQMDITMEEEIQKTKENEMKTNLEKKKTKNAEKDTEKNQEQINQTIPEEHVQAYDLSAEENTEEFETFEQSQTEHLLVDVKVVENLEEQSKESNCIWTLHDVRYPQSKKLGHLSFNCTLLQSPTILQFTLKKAKEESIDSCSVITASDIYLKEETTLRHPEYDLVLSFGFKKQEEYFSERKRKVTTVRHIPYFLDEINSFVRKLNSYLLQVYEILISYPGSDLSGTILSFRLFSYPMFFSSTVSVDLTHLFRLSDSSLSLKHEIGIRNADEKRIRKIFQDCLKHKNCLCEFAIRSNQFLFELERGTGYVSKRSHIRLLPAELRV